MICLWFRFGCWRCVVVGGCFLVGVEVSYVVI